MASKVALYCSTLLAASGIPLLAAAQKVRTVPTAQRIQFNRDIRPILSDNCFACHGPDRNKRQANLRLDQRPSALEHGAIVPGNVAKSKLVDRINTANAALQMPPASFNKTLTPAQKAILTRWVKEGGEYQQFWAYIIPTRPAVPVIRNPQSAIRNPIDSFILAKLVEKRISPNPDADKRTLCRRVYLDLVGFPPTPQEMNAFIVDTSPTAYEKLVDRLLASPHFGERMASPWLDVVRYADTVGFHGDQNMNAWVYRDYVIDSFNRNKPFDRFTIEQLAGDLLPNPTPETLTATCFNRLNMVTREGGAQPKEYLAKYAADRVRTVAMTWLGSTMGCCECHDHKFDPFTQKDFYSMAAFFADMKQWGVYADYSYTPEPELRGVDNDSSFPPEIMVESAYLKQRIARQKQQILSVARETHAGLANDAAKQAAFDSWRKSGLAFLAAHPDGWEVPAGGSVSVAGQKAESPVAELKPAAPTVAAIRLDLLPLATNRGGILRGGQAGDTLKMTVAVKKPDGQKRPIKIRYAGANYWKPRYVNGFDVVGVQGGWRLADGHETEPHVAIWYPETPVELAQGESLELSFPNIPAGSVRIAVSPFTPENLDAPAMPANLSAALDQGESNPVALAQYLLGTGWNAAALKQANALQADIAECRRGITPVMVTQAVTPRVVRLLHRGNFLDETGDVCEPAVPHFLPGAAKVAAGGKTVLASLNSAPAQASRLTRLDLARWLVSPQNPLTARVFMNRLWKQLFGQGLSLQVEDLGAQGETPSHPELLDWLAVEFRESGWDVKHMVRLLVTSATYRRSTAARPDVAKIDPANRLLASQNPRRLEAEAVRDNALRIAGLLNLDVGGPPCTPYQPAGYYANLQFPDRDYVADRDDRQWRRGVYMHWQRTFLQPMLANFDAPSREDCTASRTQANTPQQALTLLNDPEFVEAARAFAVRIMGFAGSDAARLDRACQIALGRSMKSAECDSLLRFLQTMRTEYAKRPDDAKKLLAVGFSPVPASDPIETAAWASVCRVILNLHETITRY
jgi:mono/diheme cytochrome c family protein